MQQVTRYEHYSSSVCSSELGGSSVEHVALTFCAFLALCVSRMLDWKTRSSKRRCSRWRLAFFLENEAPVSHSTPPVSTTCGSHPSVGLQSHR